VPVAVRVCTTPCGSGNEICADGAWQPCAAPQPHTPTVAATLRDFDDTDPDFEPDGGIDPFHAQTGIVAGELGADDTPVYAFPDGSTTHGPALFYDWYHDVPGVNERTTLLMPFMPEPGDAGVIGYDDPAFFPIDNQLLGNQGRAHNHDFTLELAMSFHYAGGEILRFRCDDDCWVFVNRRLALDLGGVHNALPGAVDLDAQRAMLGIATGQTYPMHFFYAERHIFGSALYIDLSAASFATCDMNLR
jgi:fibro-slime domain-containing protein